MSRKKNKNCHQGASVDSFVKNADANGLLKSNQSDNSQAKIGILNCLKTDWWAVGLIALLSLSALGAGWKFLDENAKQTIADRNASTPLNPSQEGLLSKINPLVSATSPSPTPQLSKEYIYAGSRLLAVEDANANAAPPADLAVWRPSSGAWWVLNSSGQGHTASNWGVNGDVPVPGDFDGDGKTDFSIFHPSDGSWQVLQSSNGASYGFQFGVNTDKTAQADYDGDGRTDLAIYRPDQNNLGVWYIRKSGDSSVVIQQFGLPLDLPAPADYDGDGKADIAVWRNSNSTFYSINSSNNTVQIIFLDNKTGTDVVSGDYDGDGKADYAVYDKNTANWHIRNSTSATVQTTQWGTGGDLAAQNDYDGDGRVDIAGWRNSNGNWYIRKSGSGGALRQEQWGIAGDIPVPAYYRR